MQIVAYSPTPRPAVSVAIGDRVVRIPLAVGARVDFSLGERTCAGQLRDGQHEPCTAESSPYCDRHRDTWVCARCRGDCLKPVMDCHEPHVVYLAGFAPDVIKVGVTKEARYRTRIHEQGADRAVVIRTVEDGRIAREIEAGLTTEFPDRIPMETKRAGVTDTFDEGVWENRLDPFEPTRPYRPSYPIEITHAPIAERRFSGRVSGLKGRLMVVDVRGTQYVTDLRDLVGIHVAPGRGPGDRQAALHSYGIE